MSGAGGVGTVAKPAGAEVAAEPDAPRRRLPAAVREGLILVAYTAFGLYALWPLPTTMFSAFPDLTDPYTSAWGLWWVQQKLFSLSNPWFADGLYAPYGTYLGYHALVPAAGIVFSPLTATIGAAATYNVAKLLIPVASAYVTYRLLRRLGLDWRVAALSGPLYGFASMLAWRSAYHMNFGFGAFCLPLAVLCALRLSHSWSRRDAVLCGAALGATVLADLTMALFAALVVGAVLLRALVRDRAQPGGRVARVGIAVAATVVVAAPQLVMMWRQRSIEGAPPGADLSAASWKAYDASLASLLSPSPTLRLDGVPDVASRMYSFPFGEGISAYGWGVLALMLAGVVLTWRRPAVRWLLLLWLGASVMALGPELTIGREALVPLPVEHHGQRLSGLMPYTWLVELPGFANVRVSTRFAFLGMLAAALLAGFGLAALWRSGRVLAVVGAALLALAVLEAGHAVDSEFDSVPLTRSQLLAPVRADDSTSIVVDVPLGFQAGTTGAGDQGPMEPMLRATEHGHPIAGGYVSRLDPERVRSLVEQPFYRDLLALGPEAPLGSPKPDPAGGAEDARRLNVRWVIAWPDASAPTLDYLRRAGFVPVHTVDGVRLYRRASS